MLSTYWNAILSTAPCVWYYFNIRPPHTLGVCVTVGSWWSENHQPTPGSLQLRKEPRPPQAPPPSLPPAAGLGPPGPAQPHPRGPGVSPACRVGLAVSAQTQAPSQHASLPRAEAGGRSALLGHRSRRYYGYTVRAAAQSKMLNTDTQNTVSLRAESLPSIHTCTAPTHIQQSACSLSLFVVLSLFLSFSFSLSLCLSLSVQ